MRRTDALIVGGGPAGAATAITLAAAGRPPLLIERAATPRPVVCGGFLGGDALAALAALGIDAPALGARPIHRLRIVAHGHMVERRLPFAAAGLSRATLDAALRDRALALGAIVETGRAARAIEDRPGGGAIVRLDDGSAIAAPAVFLATGKHDLRGSPRPRPAPGADPAVGLRRVLPADPDLAGRIELHLFDRGYAGLLVQEDGSVNLCLSVARSRLAEADGNPARLIAALAAASPRFAARIGGAAATGEAWQAIAAVPYGWQQPLGTEEALYRVGDQAAVIASLAGDGIAIALASGAIAARAFLAGRSPADHARALAARTRRPIAIAGAIRRLAEGPHRALLLRAAALPGAAALAARLTRVGH